MLFCHTVRSCARVTDMGRLAPLLSNLPNSAEVRHSGAQACVVPFLLCRHCSQILYKGFMLVAFSFLPVSSGRSRPAPSHQGSLLSTAFLTPDCPEAHLSGLGALAVPVLTSPEVILHGSQLLCHHLPHLRRSHQVPWVPHFYSFLPPPQQSHLCQHGTPGLEQPSCLSFLSSWDYTAAPVLGIS